MWNVTSACHFHTGEQLTPSSEVGRRQAGGQAGRQAAGGTDLCRGIHKPGDHWHWLQKLIFKCTHVCSCPAPSSTFRIQL